MYGQNKADDAIDIAGNASSGSFGQVAVAGDNTQYGTSSNPLGKSDLNKWIVNGHTNGLDLWLPSVSKSDAGLWLGVRCGVASGGASIIITAASGDLLVGHAFITKATDAVANRVYFAADGSDDLILTLNGTTTGGLIGSQAVMQVNKDGYWLVLADLTGSGSLATPFS
tara:strand:- start:45 stop:551 length:507 start_codon:yes stop_codon:yes gene_type:complete